MDKQYTLSDAMRMMRESQGRSLCDVAKRLGVSKQRLSDIELGRHSPSVATINKMAIEYEILGSSLFLMCDYLNKKLSRDVFFALDCVSVKSKNAVKWHEDNMTT